MVFHFSWIKVPNRRFFMNLNLFICFIAIYRVNLLCRLKILINLFKGAYMSEEKKTWLLNTGDDLYKNSKDFFPIGIDPDLTPSDIPSTIISAIEKVADDKFKVEIISTLRGSADDNISSEKTLTYRIKYFLSKGDTFSLRFNDYDVDDEDLDTYYFGEDDDDWELESDDIDDKVVEIDLDGENDEETEEAKLVEDLDDAEEDIFDDEDEYFDDELDENFLFSVGIQHFKVADINWNTMTLEYSVTDEDDFPTEE